MGDMWDRLIGQANNDRVKVAEMEQRERVRAELDQLTTAVEGYRRALFTDLRIPLVCQVCGASVSDSGVEIHTNWHATL